MTIACNQVITSHLLGTSGIASTSSSSTADAAVIASAPSASAPVAESLEDKVARLKECLSEASTTGKLAAVLGAMPKKTEIPKAEVAEKEEKKDPMKKEEKKDPEDPGSGVDWGDESAKEEESSSVYEEIVEEEAADPSSVPAPAADSGAVDPPRNLSGTRRSRKVREEITCFNPKSIIIHLILKDSSFALWSKILLPNVLCRTCTKTLYFP